MSNIKLCAFADESSPLIDGQIDALKRNSIEYLEIRNVDGDNISLISEQKAKSVFEKLNNNGIKVWSMGSPFGKIKITEDFTPHLDLFKRNLENAAILDAKCMRMFSFFTNEHTDAIRDEVMERLSRFVEASKGYDITLCHENEKGIYGDTADKCLEIHKAFPEIKCVFDSANYIQCGQDITAAWNMLKDYLHYIHVKDAKADGTIVPAGVGIGQYPLITKEYSNMGGGVMTLEPHLKTFDGLAALEADEKTNIDDVTYKTNEEAFDTAARAIQGIINTL